jgi:hypothetical protein
MKAKIDKDGFVEWVGRKSGESWVELPNNLPEQSENTELLHYDRETEVWSYKEP